MAKRVKRIRPEQVVEAFKQTGLSLGRGQFFSDDRACACGLGALYAMKNGSVPEDDNALEIVDWVDQTYSMHYRLGFINGFDDSPDLSDRLSITYGNDHYRTGYRDGQAAYTASVQSMSGLLQ